MSSKPSTHPVLQTPNPYPPSSLLAPGSQQPVGFTNPGQGVQHPFMTSPGVFPSSQLSQENVQVINPTAGTAAPNSKGAIKILGGIQIVIGLMHPGFGVILALLSYSVSQAWGFASISFVAGYPFWGGLSFIISGALTISAFQKISLCLLKGSLGMNIVSCIFSIIGVILLLVDLCINVQPQQVYWALVSGKGISAILMLFSLLEFCIGCASAHFATLTISNHNTSVLVIPNVYPANLVTQAPDSLPPTSDGYPPYTPRY